MPGKCMACFLLFALAFAASGADAPFAEYEIHSDWSPSKVRAIYFGRADGSRGARTTEILNGRTCTSTALWDMQTHQKITFSDCIGLITRETFVGLPPSAARTVNCVKINADKHLGTEKLGELTVEKFESTGLDRRMLYYAAPDLGCLSVGSRLEMHNGEVSTQEPVNIRLGPPAPELFAVPPTYREVTAAEWRAALTKYFKTGEK